MKELPTLSSFSEDPSVVGFLHVEEQHVPIATMTEHHHHHHNNRDSLVPIHEIICQLESQGTISKT